MAAAAVQSPPTSEHPAQLSEQKDESSCALDNTQADLNDNLPSPETLSKVSQMPVFDATGKEHKFGELYSGPGRHMVIFVRHFFCGMCQEFLHALTASVSPDDLSSLKTPTTLTIVGCGKPELIENYSKQTNLKYPIYADYSRKLYEEMELITSLGLGASRPEYQSTSTVGIVARSFLVGVSAGTNALKGGNFAQLGGEFMFENGKVTWCHRMRNTRDHSEIPVLRSVLGLTSS